MSSRSKSNFSQRNYCHMCMATDKLSIMCDNVVGDIPCNRMFCCDCVKKFFKEDVKQLMENPNGWICYCCRGLCKCAICMNSIRQKVNLTVNSISMKPDQIGTRKRSTPYFPEHPTQPVNGTQPQKAARAMSTTPSYQQPPSGLQSHATSQSTPSIGLPYQDTLSSKSITAAQSYFRGYRTSEPKPVVQQRKSSKQTCDLSVYSNRFMFHCAIYTSVSPSEGITLNCLATHSDLEYLKLQKVVPNVKYS